MKLVEEYDNCFKKLHKKVDLNNRTPVANTLCQFLSGLNLTIALLVYVSGLIDLNTVVNTTKSIKAGYKITQRNIQQ